MGSVKEEISEIKQILEEKDKKSTKKFWLPFKSRVSKKRMREGYATIVEIKENKNVNFTRERISDGTIKLEDTFHAIDPNNIFFYKGRPIIFQCKNKLNPYNPLIGKQETYGQKYVMARMEGDKLTLKRKIGWGMSIGFMIIIGIIIYAVITGS